MSIFTDRNGTQRWKCFSTGESGTAIDLYKTTQNVDTKTAIESLAKRTGTQPTQQPPRRRQPNRHTAGQRPATDGTPHLTQWVNETNRLLELPKARPAHKWLADHGIDLDHATKNNVGYDPGAARLRRGDGLPRIGPAVVLPITNQNGEITYAQSRNLRNPGPDGIKYLNPHAQVARNPTISIVEHQHNGPLFLTEGVADALVLTQHGHNAAALIGSGLTSQDKWVEPLTAAAQGRPIILAFDNDTAGHQASINATNQLRHQDLEPATLSLPANDISEWANHSKHGFADELANMITRARPLDVPTPTGPTLDRAMRL